MEIEDSESKKQISKNSSQHQIIHSQDDREVQNSQLSKTPSKTPNKLKNSLIMNSGQVISKRLVVKQIVLDNFKSYAGKQVIGPFHKRFTSVVGPNGSGKSNLIESLLFIFGRRAKDMRSKQLHQLIHNSSDDNQPKKAYVEVQFIEILDQEGEEYEIIPNSEFSVRRTVNHASVSEYEIDGHKVKAEEVTTMLKGKGIDLDNNRFLILQGEVEQISQMKPKSGDPDHPGLLEYLEDIIGSVQYKEKIEEGEKQYETLNEQRREKGERMRFSQKDLEKLNDSKNIAVDFIKKEKSLYQMQNIYYQILRFHGQQEIVKFEEKKESAEKKIQEYRTQFKEKIKQNESIMIQYKENKQKLDEATNCLKKHRASWGKIQELDNKLRSDLKFETENQVKIEHQLKELEKEYSKIIDETNEIRKDLPKKQEILTRVKEEKEAADTQFRDITNKLKQNNQKLMKARNDIKKQMDPFVNQINDLNVQASNIQTKLELQNSGNQDINEEMAHLNSKIISLNPEITELDTVINQIKTGLSVIEGEKKKCEESLRDVVQKEQEFHKELQQTQDDLNQRLQSNNDIQKQSGIVQELMRAQQNGQLSGIQGRLGDLGAIDPMYDIAISTACPQLENVVTNTLNDAQMALNFLKENKIGRMTFLPLEKMESYRNQMNNQFHAPEGSKRLFDLIRFKNEEYRTAFYFALQNTLVCQDLDVGNKIAYGQTRYRVVTLDGKLIELSGTMSGGGKPKQGLMSSKLSVQVDQEEINRLKHEVNQIRDKIQQARQYKSQMQGKLDELMRDEKTLKQTINARKDDLEDNKKQVSQIEQKLKSLQNSNLRKDNEEKDKSLLINQLNKIKEKISQIEQESQSLQQEMKKIDEELESQGGSQLANIKKKKEQFDEDYKKIDKEVSTMVSKLETRQKNLEKSVSETEVANKKLEKLNKKIDAMKKESAGIEEEAMKLLGLIAGAEERVKELEQEQQKQTEEKKMFEKMITDMKKELEKLNNDLEKFKIELKKANDSYNQSNKFIQENREKYKDIISQYDFINELDEIANYQIVLDSEKPAEDNKQQSSNQEKNQMDIEEDNLQNNSIMNISREDDNQKNKKRIKLGDDLKWVYQTDVEKDLLQIELESIDKYEENLKYKLNVQTDAIQALRSDANINTIIEFKNKFTDFKTKRTEFEQVKGEIQSLWSQIDQLKKQRLDQFMSGFNVIATKLKETYQNLTNGGDAELELIDFQDPFSDGVNFAVRPPKKAWKKISKLSGGEKTLSSLSLVFALHYFKPTPLYFMDEIDAALDFKNVSIVGHFVKERTKDAQFIIISLRNNMFELANKLIGVYKTFDQTKTISIYPEKIMLALQQEKDNQQQQQQLV